MQVEGHPELAYVAALPAQSPPYPGMIRKSFSTVVKRMGPTERQIYENVVLS